MSKAGRREQRRALESPATTIPDLPRASLVPISLWILAFAGYMVWTGFYRINAAVFYTFFRVLGAANAGVFYRNAAPLAAGLVVFASALALGHAGLRLAGMARPGWAYALGLGLGVLSHLLLLLGLVGLWSSPVLWALVAVPLIPDLLT